MHAPRRKVLMIAIDASAMPLIDQWMADGTLPHLKALVKQGAYGPMASTAQWLAGSPWPSFYTGSLPPEHGFMFHLQWRPELMRHCRPQPDWLPMTPFYRRFGDYGKRTVAVDVPITYEVPANDDFNGVEVTSWSGHDKIGRTTAFPRSLMKEIARRWGRQPLILEAGGLQTAAELLRLREELLQSVARQTALTEYLLEKEAWDFCLLSLGAAHRGGHKLWDRSSIRGELKPNDEALYDHALRDIYAACDESVGTLAKQCDENTTLLVCSLHGMQKSTSRFDMLPPMLDRVLAGGPLLDRSERRRSGVLQFLRSKTPLEWRTAAKSWFPESLQDWLSLYWRGVDQRDWATTRAFPLMGDLQALVQINLKGREAQGIVEPGQEYEALLSEIAEGLQSFVDVDTGEAVVRQIARGSDLYPEAHTRRFLPDLIVDWSDSACCEHRAIHAPRYGQIDWPHPGHPLDGRSGHHTSEGWLLAVGKGVTSGTALQGVHSHDLNATIHALLDVPRPDLMRGEPIPGIH